MERELDEHENEASKSRPADSTERLIREFYEGLAKNFDTLPPHEKKRYVEMAIGRIVVDRDDELVRVLIRRVPAVTSTIQQLVRKAKMKNLVRPLKVPGTGMDDVANNGWWVVREMALF